MDKQLSRTWRIGYLFLALIMSGCTTRLPLHEQEIKAFWDVHENKLTELNSWQFNGRIAVQTEKDAWSATLYWQQREQDYTVRIITPFGRGTYELSGNDTGVSMRTAGNELLSADNPETLLQNNFGWYVPLTGIIYWVKGIPQPGNSVDEILLDQHGRISQLSQLGWQINYLSYTSNSNYELPEKFVMHNKKLKVRLIIKDWKI